MVKIEPTTKQVGYMLFPGLGHTVYLTKEDIRSLKGYPNNVLHVLVTTSVCQVMDITIDELFSKTRKQPAPLARHICMYSLVVDFGMSLKGVARILRPVKPYNHSTIHHGRETIKDYLDPADGTRFAKGVREIYSKLNLKLKAYINEGNRTNRQSRQR